MAIERASIEQHLQECAVVRDGRGKPGAAGEVGVILQRIVWSDRLVAEDLPGVLLEFARRRLPVELDQAAGLGVGHAEVGVVHAERLEDPLPEERVEGLSRDLFDEAAEQIGVESVGPPFPGLMHQGDGRESVHGGKQIVAVHPEAGWDVRLAVEGGGLA